MVDDIFLANTDHVDVSQVGEVDEVEPNWG